MELIKHFRMFPKFVRSAWLWLGAGWGLHFLFLYLTFVLGRQDPPTKILYQMLAICGLLFVFLYQGRKWAWVLCLLCNALVMLSYALFAALFAKSKPELALLAVLVLGSFGASTGYLLTAAARVFYAGPEQVPVPDSKKER